MRRVGEAEGVAICPETAVCFEALVRLVAAGKIARHEEIVIFNTGAAYKYVEALRAVERRPVPRLRPGEKVDWRAIAAGFERAASL
jgi:threonine synthase